MSTVVPVEDNLHSYENQAFSHEPDIVLKHVRFMDPDRRKSRALLSNFQLLWKDVSREVDLSYGIWPFNTVKRRTILNPMNGFVDAGSITALMGPSGAGKTTLLKIIANKISPKLEGVTGRIVIRHNLPSKEAKSFRIGYVPQNDCLFTEFTVKETLLFASRMIHGHYNSEEHTDAVETVMRKLDLFEAEDTPVKNLSGGQMKRTSIGAEMMGEPQVLILDEPTSGLDSDTSESVIRILKNMVRGQNKTSLQREDAPAVLATIHQPSRDVFFLFDSIFLLSRTGYNIYSGSPERVFDFLKSFGYSSSRNTNPAEYMIEFANGKHDMKDFEAMSNQTYDKTRAICSENKYKLKREIQVKNLRMKTSTSFLTQLWLLFSRHVTKQTFKSNWTFLKLLTGIIVANFIFNISKKPFGDMDGCWTSVAVLGKNLDGNLDVNFLGLVQSMKNGIAFTFLSVQYELMFYVMALVFVFPLELPTYMKEMSNSWYSPLAFCISHFLSNTFHHLVAFLPMFAFMYWVSSQPLDTFARPIIAFLVLFIFGIANESKGEIICIIFNKSHAMIPMIMTVVATMPPIFLSGFAVRVENMIDFFQPAARYNDITNAFEAVLITMFGMNRCPPLNDTTTQVLATEISFQSIMESFWTNANYTGQGVRALSVGIGLDPDYLDPVIDSMNGFVNRSISSSSNAKEDPGPSFMLNIFHVRDEDFMMKIYVILTYFTVIKIAAFFMLRHRVTARND